ncbi:tumor necrosis factor receptor superfamily member 1A-like isoform X1 [Ranitomeya imitator]|uniref:tumor necrosis factor receptor superfamily member 1A-like isoform X1 n=1 Tax=Ranitomeya imitator TaxID=111125 RepID=UPI0037E8F972
MLSIWLPPLLLALLKVTSPLPANLHNGNVHNRTVREIECNSPDDEYWHNGHCCRRCPAGTHVSAHCTVNHDRGVCEACTRGEDYTAAPSGMEACLSCATCKDDQVLVRECTPEANAECECKPGSYCIPNVSCEICRRCSRCGEGQRIKNPCTPTSDTVCEDVSATDPTSTKANVNDQPTVLKPNDSFNDVTRRKAIPTDPPHDQAGSQLILYIGLPIACFLLIIIIVIVGYHCYRKKANENSKNSLLGTTQNSENTSLDSVRAEDKNPKEEELPPEHQPLVTPEPGRIEQQIHQMAVPCLVGAQREPEENHVAESPEGDVQYEESPQVGEPCKLCGTLQPCDKQWSDFFYCVIDNVDQKNITQLARKLHLSRNTINQISNDNSHDCRERNYQLFEKWREQNGKQASMKNVLKQLDDMDLRGCRENIVNGLRTKNIPMN